MSYKLSTPKNTRQVELLNKNTGSFTSVVGALYAYSLTTGSLALAGTATDAFQQLWIALEAQTTTTNFAGLRVNPGDTFLVNTTANTAAGQVGQRGIIDATGLLYTNSGTDVTTGPFQMIAVVGAAADKKALVVHV